MSARTVEIAASADDANLFRIDTVYPPTTTQGGPQNGNTTIPTRKDFLTPNYENQTIFLRFDTSVIPDTATVTAAKLQIYCGNGDSTVNTNTRSVNFEWFSWAPTLTQSSWADEVGTSANTTTLAALIALGAGRVTDFVLSNPAANVSTTGFTGIRFGISGSTPTGENSVFFWPFDHATNPAPSLYVEYTGGDFRPSYAQFPKNPLRTAA